VLDDGRLTDAKGRIVDFKNTIIIMTSNLGSHILMNAAQEGRPFEEAEKEVMDLLKSYFRPEFLNRVDDIVFFKPLTMDEIKEIAKLQLSYVAQRLSQQQIYVEFTDAAIENLAKVGFDPELGARPLRRAIQKEIENRIAEKMVLGEVAPGDVSSINPTSFSFLKAATVSSSKLNVWPIANK